MIAFLLNDYIGIKSLNWQFPSDALILQFCSFDRWQTIREIVEENTIPQVVKYNFHVSLVSCIFLP